MKLYTGNHSFLKDLNIITTLRLIQERTLISRAALADALGLNRSTITAIVHDLLAQQLVKEVGIGAPKGGRPPTLLQFNSDAAYTVSIEWAREQIRVFVTNLGGEVYFSQHLAASPSTNAHDQIRLVIQTVADALHPLPTKPLGLLGIGIIVPGIVEKGIVTSYSLDWNSVPLVSLFAESFACPIVVNNDAHAGLIAESYFGLAKGEQHVVYIRVGSSLSAAFISDGQLVQGSDGFAGRVGHNVLVEKGRKCVCGNRGCWEAYTSEHALIQRYVELSGKKAAGAEGAAGLAADEGLEAVNGEPSLEHVVAGVQQSEPSALRAVHELAEYLGMGAANLVNLLNPKLLVIGHTLGNVDPLLMASFDNAFKARALPFLRRNIKVHFISLNERSLTLGATALVLDAIFSPPTLKSRELEG